MGNSLANVYPAQYTESSNTEERLLNATTAPVWRKEGYHEDYTKSPMLPDDRDDVTEYIELLAILDTPAGQNFMGKLSMQLGTQSVFFLWTDIQEYKAIPTVDYRYTKAKQLFGKYLRGSSTHADYIPEEMRRELYECLEHAGEDRALLGPDLFLEVQKVCFRQIFDKTFLVLKRKHADRYASYKEIGEERYNRVDVNDFDYMEKLGEGTFGKVVHVMKKSTGRHFAMKIQQKKGMLRSVGPDLEKLDNEKMVLQACHHPFLLQMDYALQTELHAIIVLNLVTTGNLQDAIDNSPKRRLEEPRARFYAAEITLALFHLHDMGLMYRDLKPRNVMLGMDGHIQLADFGGVGDCIGDLSARKVRKHGVKVVTNLSKNPFKRLSIMGTKGYMAPEMAKLFDKSSETCLGYTESVDWWSLGATVFKMMTGTRPFDPHPWIRRRSILGLFGKQTEFQKLQGEVSYPRYLPDRAVSFISGLLRHDVDERLGCGPAGKENIMSHKFFTGIKWERLEAKNVEPPYIPPEQPAPLEQPMYESFEEMMKALDEEDSSKRRFSRKKYIAAGKLTAAEQKHFATWRYVSPQTLKVEMGIAKAMEDLEANYKIMQLTGESSLSASSHRQRNELKKTGKVVVTLGRVLSAYSAKAARVPQPGVSASKTATVPPLKPINRPRITMKPPHL